MRRRCSELTLDSNHELKDHTIFLISGFLKETHDNYR